MQVGSVCLYCTVFKKFCIKLVFVESPGLYAAHGPYDEWSHRRDS